MTRYVVFVACAVLAVPALAAGTFYGRWAFDLTACAQDAVTGPLVVSPMALQWPDTRCAVRTSYRVGDVWHISARCPDAASDVPVKLELKADRLMVEWGGARAALRRCP